MEQQLQCQCFSLWTVVWQNDEEFQFHVENLCPPHIQDLVNMWTVLKNIQSNNNKKWHAVAQTQSHHLTQSSSCWWTSVITKLSLVFTIVFLFQLNSVKFCHESLWLCGSFLRSFPAFLFLFLLRKLSSLPLFFSSWYLSANSSFFFSATRKKKT